MRDPAKFYPLGAERNWGHLTTQIAFYKTHTAPYQGLDKK